MTKEVVPEGDVLERSPETSSRGDSYSELLTVARRSLKFNVNTPQHLSPLSDDRWSKHH